MTQLERNLCDFIRFHAKDEHEIALAAEFLAFLLMSKEKPQ